MTSRICETGEVLGKRVQSSGHATEAYRFNGAGEGSAVIDRLAGDKLLAANIRPSRPALQRRNGRVRLPNATRLDPLLRETAAFPGGQARRPGRRAQLCRGVSGNGDSRGPPPGLRELNRPRGRPEVTTDQTKLAPRKGREPRYGHTRMGRQGFDLCGHRHPPGNAVEAECGHTPARPFSGSGPQVRAE